MENEIRKSDRGVLMEVVNYLSGEPYPTPETLKKIKAGIEAHLEATKGESSSWQTHSRQLIAETEAQTTRLLATEFVADEAVGLVVELAAALGQLHLVAATVFPPENEKVPPLWRVPIQQAATALTKAAQFTAAGTAPTVGGASEPVIFPPDEVEAVPEYEPHWPGIPEAFDHVAVDKNGMVFAYVGHPIKKDESMWGTGKFRLVDSTYITEIPPPPGDTWEKMVYKRPE